MDKETIATRALRRALEIHERMQERLAERLDIPLGRERVGSREVRKAIREALGGDEVAMAKVRHLAALNGHQAGEGQPCPLCQNINVILSLRRGEEGG